MRKILIISGILAATFGVYLCVVGIILTSIEKFENFSFSNLIVLLICILGITGYIGLWKTLLANSETNLRLTQTFLFAGLLSLLLTIIMILTENLKMNVAKFPEDMFRFFLTFWPGFVTIYLLLTKNKKAFKKI
jgi:hypothetical protein